MTELPGYLIDHAAAIRALHREVAADRYLVATGQQKAATAAIYDTYPQLTDGRLLRRALDRGDHDIAVELVMLHLRVRLRSATDQLRHAQANCTAEFDGRPHTHSQLLAAARGCRDQAQRAAVNDALGTVSRELRTERLHWLRAFQQVRAELGYSSNGAFIRALHPDVDAWINRATAWLDATRTAFLRRWDRWRGEDGIAEPRLRDVLAVGSARLPDGVDGLATVRAALENWGFAEDLRGVTIDVEARPGKIAMSFCSPVDPPHDVRLSTVTPRLWSDVVTTMHEYTHAAHYTALPGITAAWRVGAAAMEAVGLAVEQVALRPDWTSRHLGWQPPESLLQRHLFRRAAVRRLVTASLVYEMAVHDDIGRPEENYQRIFSREFNVIVDPIDAYNRLQTYLEAQPCYPLVYTKAYSLADRMFEQLSNDGGTDWYLQAHAGEQLRCLFLRAADSDEAMPAG
jgi:hypothetical protein